MALRYFVKRNKFNQEHLGWDLPWEHGPQGVHWATLVTQDSKVIGVLEEAIKLPGQRVFEITAEQHGVLLKKKAEIEHPPKRTTFPNPDWKNQEDPSRTRQRRPLPLPQQGASSSGSPKPSAVVAEAVPKQPVRDGSLRSKRVMRGSPDSGVLPPEVTRSAPSSSKLHDLPPVP